MVWASEPPMKYRRSADLILIRRFVVDCRAGVSGFGA
jgi:hypothetical protein